MSLDGDGRCNWCGDSGAEHGCPECNKIGDLGFICEPYQTSKVVKLTSCQKHPTSIPKWPGTLEELAYAVENMRYDKTALFLVHLKKAFMKRCEADHKAGKDKLSHKLSDVAAHINVAASYAIEVWEICKPYMDIKEE